MNTTAKAGRLPAEIMVSDNHTIGEALCKASEIGHHEGVQHLMKLVSVDFDDGRPLMNAIRNDHEHIVKVLIGAGARINIRDNGPLRTAVYLNRVDIVRVLIEAGANIHAGENLPLRLAVEEGHLEMAECLMSNGAQCQKAGDERMLSTLDVPVCNSNLPMLAMLVSKGASIEDVTETGLIEAARFGRVHTFDFLVERGVLVDRPNVRRAASEDMQAQAWFDALDMRSKLERPHARAVSAIRRSST